LKRQTIRGIRFNSDDRPVGALPFDSRPHLALDGQIVADIVVWGIARSKLGFWMA